MSWNPFKKRQPLKGDHAPAGDDTPGQYGFGPVALAIRYKQRRLPPVDNAGSFAYQTYLSPPYTPIGGGIPNKRDFVDSDMPLISVQGMLASQVGSPGILAGQFTSGPLTNVSAEESTQPVPAAQSFHIPAN